MTMPTEVCAPAATHPARTLEASSPRTCDPRPAATARPRRRLGIVLGLLALLGVAPAGQAQDLNRQVNDAIGSAHLSGASIGINIIDVQTGRELVSVSKNSSFIPASNMKLLTSAAALAAMGAGFEFRTRLERHGDKLILMGAGDPALADPALLEEMGISLDDFIDRLARSVEKAGMKQVTEVIVDDRIFDREYVHPDWPRNQLDNAYCAEVSGLTFHANVIEVFASPSGKDGDPAIIRVEPNTSAIEIKKKARTVRGGDGSTKIGAVRQGKDNSFTISGTVSSPIKKAAQTTLHEASLVMAQMLSERLSAIGIPCAAPGAAPAAESPADRKKAPIAPVRLASLDEEFAKADEVLAIVRTPISVALRRCNSDSENLYAESFCKLIGHESTGLPGTWGSGASSIRMQIRDRLGPEFAASVFIADGSGMSRMNRVTPSLLASWLVDFAKNPKLGATLIESIPRAGMEGTMAHRFRNNPVKNEVRGKSGYINGVRTLSGYVTHLPSQRRVAFSILINDIPTNGDAKAKELHEEVVQIIDKWLTKECKDFVEKERVGG